MRVSSMTEPATDPRVTHLADSLEALWADEDSFPTCQFEAQLAVDTLDRWDQDNGVQRATSAYIAELLADLSKARAALEAASIAFEVGGTEQLHSANGLLMRVVVVGRVAPETVERWRFIAEGGA